MTSIILPKEQEDKIVFNLSDGAATIGTIKDWLVD